MRRLRRATHVRSRVARIKNIFELLTVMHARIVHHVTAHEFERPAFAIECEPQRIIDLV